MSDKFNQQSFQNKMITLIKDHENFQAQIQILNQQKVPTIETESDPVWCVDELICENFSSRSEDVIYSESIIVEGRVFWLALYPKGFLDGKNTHISVIANRHGI